MKRYYGEKIDKKYLKKMFDEVFITFLHNYIQAPKWWSNETTPHFIEKLYNLDVLEKLEEINLSHNKIKLQEGLEKCHNLMVINLSYNLVNNLRSIKNVVPSVLKLSLKKNAMNEQTNIETFPNVKFLKLSRNDISSYQEILKLSKLKNLKGLSLYKNPIELDEAYSSKILSICPIQRAQIIMKLILKKKEYESTDPDIDDNGTGQEVFAQTFGSAVP